MRQGLKVVSAIGVAALLMLGPVTTAVGAPGGQPGKPTDVGQGNGGGKPNPGKSQGKGGLYADLMVIARDSDGLPILDGNGCYQPITDDPSIAVAEFVDANLYPYDGPVFAIPLVGSIAALAEDDDELEPCDPASEYYAGFVSEVDLGRLNLGRSPERVLLKQLDDVVASLSGATVTLDASGRLVADGATIDSPLQNLTVYQSILETGKIGPLDVPAVALDDWGLTAAAVAAGSPKEAFAITVDTIQYLNRILDIPADTYRATLTDATGESFLDFGAVEAYDRADVFPGCIAWDPAYNPAQASTSVMESVFYDEGNTATGNVDAYVQFAEDARKVLVFVHDQGILIDSVDPILEDSGNC